MGGKGKQTVINSYGGLEKILVNNLPCRLSLFREECDVRVLSTTLPARWLTKKHTRGLLSFAGSRSISLFLLRLL